MSNIILSPLLKELLCTSAIPFAAAALSLNVPLQLWYKLTTGRASDAAKSSKEKKLIIKEA